MVWHRRRDRLGALRRCSHLANRQFRAGIRHVRRYIYRDGLALGLESGWL